MFIPPFLHVRIHYTNKRSSANFLNDERYLFIYVSIVQRVDIYMQINRYRSTFTKLAPVITVHFQHLPESDSLGGVISMFSFEIRWWKPSLSSNSIILIADPINNMLMWLIGENSNLSVKYTFSFTCNLNYVAVYNETECHHNILIM